MIKLKDLMELFNNNLEQDGFIERFTYQIKTFDSCEFGEETYESIIIPHKNKEFSIELSYEGDWIISYLGTHSHINGIESLDELIDIVYKDYIVPILTDKIVAIHEYCSDGSLCMSVDMLIPDKIPFIFSKKEKEEFKKYKAVSWLDKNNTIDVICYILSEREDVNEYRIDMFEERINQSKK